MDFSSVGLDDNYSVMSDLTMEPFEDSFFRYQHHQEEERLLLTRVASPKAAKSLLAGVCEEMDGSQTNRLALAISHHSALDDVSNHASHTVENEKENERTETTRSSPVTVVVRSSNNAAAVATTRREDSHDADDDNDDDKVDGTQDTHYSTQPRIPLTPMEPLLIIETDPDYPGSPSFGPNPTTPSFTIQSDGTVLVSPPERTLSKTGASLSDTNQPNDDSIVHDKRSSGDLFIQPSDNDNTTAVLALPSFLHRFFFFVWAVLVVAPWRFLQDAMTVGWCSVLILLERLHLIPSTVS